jgi:hypothetical protein
MASVVSRIATASMAVCGFTRKKAVGNVAQAFDVGAEILCVAFHQPCDFNGDRIAGVWIVERGRDFGFGQTGELRGGGDDAGHD